MRGSSAYAVARPMNLHLAGLSGGQKRTLLGGIVFLASMVMLTALLLLLGYRESTTAAERHVSATAAALAAAAATDGNSPDFLYRHARDIGLDDATVLTLYTNELEPRSSWPLSGGLDLTPEELSSARAELLVRPAAKITRKRGDEKPAVEVIAKFAGSPFLVGVRASERSYFAQWRREAGGLVLFALFSISGMGVLVLQLVRSFHEEQRAARELDVVKALKQDAEDANAAKSEYLAIMSHEIRTSMSGVLGMAEFMLRSKLYKEQHSSMRVLYDAGQNLVQIINKVLDYSKIESGSMELSLAAFEPGDLVTRVGELFAKEAQNKNLTLEIFGVASPIWVLGDELRVRQILANLVGNAVKFTTCGGVSLALTAVPSSTNQNAMRLHFAVRDSGPGIACEMIPSLFQPFHQIDSGVARRFGGTGLGLSICKRLSDLMGGTLRVESTPGSGSTFHFEIECDRVGRLLEQPVDASPVEEAPRTPTSVLVVEDNLSNQKIVQMYLEGDGYTVSCASDGSEAVELFRVGKYDVILMDGAMPGMDGYEASRAIRAIELTERRGRTPIIATTANTGEENEMKCIHAGMDDFVPKPYRFSDLKVKMSKWVDATR